LAIFTPVILWNADPPVVSFMKQFGRGAHRGFSSGLHRRTGSDQIAFATPLVFILGAMGLSCAGLAQRRRAAGRALLSARCFWTIVALFFVGTRCTARVEANWFAPVYPAVFVSRPPVAAHRVPWEIQLRARLADFAANGPPVSAS